MYLGAGDDNGLEWSCQFSTSSTDEFTASQLTAMLGAVESSLDTLPLTYRIDTRGRFVRVEEPGHWAAKELAAGGSALLCTGRDSDELYAEMLVMTPHLSQVALELPRNVSPERIASLMREFARASHAHWGHATPRPASVAIAQGAAREHVVARPSSFAQIPGRFGWLSYWSPHTCMLLGFHPGDQRLRLFAGVEYLPTGVLLQLTDAVLDLGREDHVTALREAYSAFPRIAENWSGH